MDFAIDAPSTCDIYYYFSKINNYEVSNVARRMFGISKIIFDPKKPCFRTVFENFHRNRYKQRICRYCVCITCFGIRQSNLQEGFLSPYLILVSSHYFSHFCIKFNYNDLLFTTNWVNYLYIQNQIKSYNVNCSYTYTYTLYTYIVQRTVYKIFVRNFVCSRNESLITIAVKLFTSN